MQDDAATRHANESVARPTGQVLLDYAAGELAQAIACLRWRGARLHAGVHLARKSIRRVRATLALGMPRLGPGAALIERELRRVNRRLSKLRDAHALVVALDAVRAKAEPMQGDTARALSRLRRTAAASRAAQARHALQGDPQLADTRALLTTLLAALPALQWPAVQPADAEAALTSSLSALDAASERVRHSDRDADWHRWRRRTRRWSQQQRALGKAVELSARVRKHGKRLAIALGQAQDYALILEHCGKRSPFAEADRQRLRELTSGLQQQLRTQIAAGVEEFARLR